LKGAVIGPDEALVDDLAQRISFVLDSQREMLATLELLTRDTLVPSSPVEDLVME